jgi:hypothetical protein
MSPPMLTAAATMMCPHGGTVAATPSATNAVAAAPVLTESDTFVIAGCAFNVAGAPSPCVSVQWTGAAAQVTRGGAPVLTSASVGLCLAATMSPQGSVIIAGGQTEASAT